MGRTVINVELNYKSIDEAIKEIEKYERDTLKKIELFQKKLADAIAEEAQILFNNSIVDDVINGSPRRPNVTVEASTDGTVVIANGADAVWVEFGTGVSHNTSAGTSPHPKGAELGFTIGSFGKGMGKREVWGFPDGNGGITLTRGTPATMPMYNAMMSVVKKAETIAREVWK